MPMRAPRENAVWIRDLRACGPVQAAAITDLRGLLLRGLATSFQARGDMDQAFLEDVVQQALVHILDHLEQFQGRSRFTTWAIAIAVRLAMSALRRKRWQDVSLESMTELSERVPAWDRDDTTSPDQHAEQHAMVETLRRLIDEALTDKQWVAMTAELGGMPLEEIARRMDSNVNAVYKLLHDARQRLKHGLETAGYTAEDVRSAFA
ncbi:MAG TPA: sigma-70 family RNA polymerase sigma factor [Candidatus Saccharimonadia bacterium]|nr:sigma-70 family RNA polymerase sigma factor [Candidatus Saccharimonadia bacterium]